MFDFANTAITGNTIVYARWKVNDKAFKNKGLATVTISNSITRIGAFAHNKLTSVTISRTLYNTIKKQLGGLKAGILLDIMESGITMPLNGSLEGKGLLLIKIMMGISCIESQMISVD